MDTFSLEPVQGDRVGSGRWAPRGAHRGRILSPPHSFLAWVRGFPVLGQHSQKDGDLAMLTASHSPDGIISHLGLCVSQGPAGRPGKNHWIGDVQSVARIQFMNHEAYCIQLAHSTG